MAQDESGCADQPDKDIDERLMSDNPEVQREGYAMAFERYVERLYAFLRACYWYCLSREDTADLCGSTFVAFMKKVKNKRYEPKGKVLGLLIGIARNHFKQLMKTRGRVRECHVQYLEELGIQDISEEKLKEVREAIHYAVVRDGILPGFERLVFTKWEDLVIQNGGFLPKTDELRDYIFGPPTKAVFGTELAEEGEYRLKKLKGTVKKARDRAFMRLRDYFERKG